MLRLNYWNLAILILTFLTAILHVIHLSLLNHLNLVQRQSKKIFAVTPQFSSPDEEARTLFYTLELALKQDEALDSSGSYKVSSRLTRFWKDTTSSVPIPDLTLVTHTSYKSLYKIVTTVQYWQGPVSVAVFAHNHEMTDALWSIATLMACHPTIKASVSFSIVSPVSAQSSPPLVPPDTSPLGPCALGGIDNGPLFLKSHKIPVNILRNAARRAATSEFVLVIDIDMLPSENLRQDFLLFAAQKGLYKRQNPHHKSVFVIPTFEAREDAEIPLHKSHLLSFIETGEIRPYFSEICKKCQEKTNYDAWLKDPIGSEMTPLATVLWKDPWEPFYIARNNAPLYDERFKQYGFNRISQMCELHVSGYVFSVMKKAFLVHRGFKTLESFNLETESEQKNDLLLYRQFKAELKVKYMHSTRKC